MGAYKLTSQRLVMDFPLILAFKNRSNILVLCYSTQLALFWQRIQNQHHWKPLFWLFNRLERFRIRLLGIGTHKACMATSWQLHGSSMATRSIGSKHWKNVLHLIYKPIRPPDTLCYSVLNLQKLDGGWTLCTCTSAWTVCTCTSAWTTCTCTSIERCAKFVISVVNHFWM